MHCIFAQKTLAEKQMFFMVSEVKQNFVSKIKNSSIKKKK